MTRSEKVPPPVKGDWRWMATSLHTCGSGLSSQSPNGHAHIWPTLWSICHRLQIHFALSLSDHQHCVWMCYSSPNTHNACRITGSYFIENHIWIFLKPASSFATVCTSVIMHISEACYWSQESDCSWYNHFSACKGNQSEKWRYGDLIVLLCTKADLRKLQICFNANAITFNEVKHYKFIPTRGKHA